MPLRPANSGLHCTAWWSLGAGALACAVAISAQTIDSGRPKRDPSTVSLSAEPNGTNFVNASTALRISWKRPGGDYVDAKGVINGPDPHARVRVEAIDTLTLDISGIDGDVLLRFEGGPPPKWSQAMIDDLPAQAFWVDGSSNRAWHEPMQMPAFVLNPLRGRRLTIRLDNVYRPGFVLADKVHLPVVPTLAPVAGGIAAGVTRDADVARRAEVLRYVEMKNEATLRQHIARGDIAEPFAYEPEWIVSPNGLPVLRVASHPTNQRLISWALRFDPQDEVYARYAVMIEDDVADGMNELGVKLPGLAGEEISWRMEHGPIAPGNRGLYAALDYRYAADTGSGFGDIRDMGAVFRAGRWYTIEQYIRLNSPGKADGIGRVWINGNLTSESINMRWRDKPTSRVNHVHVNIYHGGMGLPKRPIHYRIAAIAVAKSPIGVPPELLDSDSGKARR